MACWIASATTPEGPRSQELGSCAGTGMAVADLHNGLTGDENRRLADAPIDDAILLALAGLVRVQSTCLEHS